MKRNKASPHSLQSSSASILGQDNPKFTSQFSALKKDDHPLSRSLRAPSMDVNEDT